MLKGIIMKFISKMYRVFLWVGFIFSATCLLASFFINAPVEAEMRDIIIFRVRGAMLFAVFTLAFAMKLFCGKSIFAVRKAGREFGYWIVVCIIAVLTVYFISFAHTEKYQTDYLAYIAAQKSSSEDTPEESTAPVETTTTITTTTTTKSATSVVEETTTKAIETEPATEAGTEPATEAETEPATAPDALIDSNGMTYYFDDKVEFEDFDVKINRLKLVSDLDYVESGYNYYYIMIDYTIYNKTDSDIYYYMRNPSGFMGKFRFNGYERWLGHNYTIKDDDFIETESFKRSDGESVSGHESVNRFFCGIIHREIDDPEKGMRLRIDDEMEFDIYFSVGDVYNIVTLELN